MPVGLVLAVGFVTGCPNSAPVRVDLTEVASSALFLVTAGEDGRAIAASPGFIVVGGTAVFGDVPAIDANPTGAQVLIEVPTEALKDVLGEIPVARIVRLELHAEAPLSRRRPSAFERSLGLPMHTATVVAGDLGRASVEDISANLTATWRVEVGVSGCDAPSELRPLGIRQRLVLPPVFDPSDRDIRYVHPMGELLYAHTHASLFLIDPNEPLATGTLPANDPRYLHRRTVLPNPKAAARFNFARVDPTRQNPWRVVAVMADGDDGYAMEFEVDEAGVRHVATATLGDTGADVAFDADGRALVLDEEGCLNWFEDGGLIEFDCLPRLQPVLGKTRFRRVFATGNPRYPWFVNDREVLHVRDDQTALGWRSVFIPNWFASSTHVYGVALDEAGDGVYVAGDDGAIHHTDFATLTLRPIEIFPPAEFVSCLSGDPDRGLYQRIHEIVFVAGHLYFGMGDCNAAIRYRIADACPTTLVSAGDPVEVGGGISGFFNVQLLGDRLLFVGEGGRVLQYSPVP